jgi:NAD dependent epimerase/dehydratase family enzyme
MCNPNQNSTVCGFLLVQSGRAGRTYGIFFCHRLHQGTAPHVTVAISGASTLVAMGEYSQFFTVPVRFERQQQQFYDQVSNVAGSPQVEIRWSSSRKQYILHKCFLNAAHVIGALADPVVKPARRSDESRRQLIALNT